MGDQSFGGTRLPHAEIGVAGMRPRRDANRLAGLGPSRKSEIPFRSDGLYQ